MLEQVLNHIHNRFEVDEIHGTFTVADGTLPLFLQEGQYYWVEGSVFNDGLHQHPATGMTDETFKGTVTSMAVPRALVELSERIADWQRKHGEAAEGPYQSESFGGYSYSKKSGAGGSAGTTDGWRAAFRSDLNPWRKLA